MQQYLNLHNKVKAYHNYLCECLTYITEDAVKLKWGHLQLLEIIMVTNAKEIPLMDLRSKMQRHNYTPPLHDFANNNYITISTYHEDGRRLMVAMTDKGIKLYYNLLHHFKQIDVSTHKLHLDTIWENGTLLLTE